MTNAKLRNRGLKNIFTQTISDITMATPTFRGFWGVSIGAKNMNVVQISSEFLFGIFGNFTRISVWFTGQCSTAQIGSLPVSKENRQDGDGRNPRKKPSKIEISKTLSRKQWVTSLWPCPLVGVSGRWFRISHEGCEYFVLPTELKKPNWNQIIIIINILCCNLLNNLLLL